MNSPLGTNENNQRHASEPLAGSTGGANEKREAARRRFLKMSAGGSAAMVVTVMHRRAYAGIKKGAVYSACVSLQGTPDIKHMKQKKALETSAMGTPKGLVCYPRNTAPKNCTDDPDKGDSKYFAHLNDIAARPTQLFPDNTRGENTQNFKNVRYWEHGLKDGCGDLDETIFKSYPYRLYKEGYCPVVMEGGELKYDKNAFYWKRDGSCDPKAVECTTDYDDKDPTKKVTFNKYLCE